MAKGFAPWKPKPETFPFLADVIEIIEAYRDDWPLTQRSWLYRLIAKKGWLKVDEHTYRGIHLRLVGESPGAGTPGSL
ncbi:MAG: hypothetical protein GQ538_12715 [Xanthomonadales bacterium]|nr:hypothetical protein [Xanthomonadales bacterium]